MVFVARTFLRYTEWQKYPYKYPPFSFSFSVAVLEKGIHRKIDSFIASLEFVSGAIMQYTE